MSFKNYFMPFVCLCLVFHAQAQTKDTLGQPPLPVFAFAAMPTFLGVQFQNAFSHDRQYTTFGQQELSLPIDNGKQFRIYGSLPVLKKRKGFGVKLNFAYDHFKNKIGETTLNDEVVIENAEAKLTNAHLALNLSQEIVFKKWKKKLILSASYSTTGKGYGDLSIHRGIFSANLPLRVKANSLFLIGVTGIVGKNIKQPIIPTIAYFTKLGKAINLELIYPVSAQLRYVVSPRANFTMGAKTGSQTPYLDKEILALQSFDDALEFKSKNLRYYLSAEKTISKMIWLNLEVGYNKSLKSALITPNVDPRNRFFVGSDFEHMYAKIGIFMRPLFGFRKRKQAS